jgi:hypothetical protein
MSDVKRHLIVFLCLLAVSAPLWAQPHLSGNLSGNLGPGSYIVDGNCTVQSGATLTIAPGTTFLHTGNYSWTIYGQLIANGTQADSIFFLRQNPVTENRWGGLRFQAGSSPNSSVNYCVVDNCNFVSGGGLSVNGIALSISHSRISNCTGLYPGGGGIYALSANIVVDNCLIINNDCPGGGNGGGVFLENCPAPRLSNSVIAYNTDTGG